MSRIVLLIKAIGQFKHSGKHYLLNGRWHKLHDGKPQPRGAPIAHGLPDHQQFKPAKHFSDDEWQGLRLDEGNKNAKSYNKHLSKLREYSESGDFNAMVGASYGTNTYGKKLAIVANKLLEMHGTHHRVTPGQKAGEHTGVQFTGDADSTPDQLSLFDHFGDEPAEAAAAQAAPAPAAETQTEKPVSELRAKLTAALNDAPQATAAQTEPASPAAAADPQPAIAIPAFIEGKTTTGVVDYYNKQAAKVLALVEAGDLAGLQAIKADGLQPNSKGKVGNTWKGKTENSKLLLAMHDDALAALGGDRAGPIEGERNADGLVFRDGRWHRDEQPAAAYWQNFDDDSGSLNIPRAEMPQIAAKDHAEFVEFLGERGIDVSAESMPAAKLKPAQAEFSPAKVEAAGNADVTRSVLVSSDGYVIDGHHQWLAAKAAGDSVPAMVLSAPIDEALALAREFPTTKAAREGAKAAQADADRDRAARVARAEKLRQAGQKLLSDSESNYSRGRQTNTARRARMAASAEQSAANSIRIANTMINLAEAIESGEAKTLDKLTSKAGAEMLDTLAYVVVSDADNKLDIHYSARQQLDRYRSPTDEEIDRFAEFPSIDLYGGHFRLNTIIEKMGDKRGAGALANRLRREGLTQDTYAELKKMLGNDKAKDTIGWYNDEMLARIARYQRLGINNTDELRAALKEFVTYRSGTKKLDPVRAAERAIVGRKVGFDFFPTPKLLSAAMSAAAGIKPGMRVLEPSAGNGHLADAAKADGAVVDTLEISSDLRNILSAKGHSIVGYDFETYEPDELYDAVLMNPPFSDRKDALHIQRAWDMVKPGGKLIAIAGEGVFFGTDRKAVAFRQWLDDMGAEVEVLPAGTFMGADLPVQTGANARLIKLSKAAEAAAPVTASAQDDGPMEGERNADGLVFRNGRWHRDDEPATDATPVSEPDAEAEKLAVEVAEAEQVEDLFTAVTNDPRGESTKQLINEVVEKRVSARLAKETDDENDPNSPNYRFADTGYIAGSRKEEAASSVIARAKRDGAQVMVQHIDWDGLEQNPREAKELITKSNLFGQVPWDTLRESGMEPGAAFLIDRIYASLAKEPSDNTPAARRDYTLGLQTLRNRLESCKTADDVTKTLEDIRDEYEGIVYTAEEADRYSELGRQIGELEVAAHALSHSTDELYSALRKAGATQSDIYYKRLNRERRKWKPDPELEKAHAEAEARYNALNEQFRAERDVINPKVKAMREAVTALFQQQKAVRISAIIRNRAENPLHRAWLVMGERFNGVLNYRRHSGSDAFATHVTNAKNGRIDWSWLEKNGVKMPKAKKESVRFQMKVAESSKRVGGRKVSVDSTQALKNRFNLRDVQSGNWVLNDPVSAKFHVESAAAAFADLADIIGIPDEQVSFNGRLAMAFGARGTGFVGGAAAAHYEPVQRVINLTKMAGGGALAHEWLHALDNLLIEAQGLGDAGAKTFVTTSPAMLPPGELREAITELRDTMMKGTRRLKRTFSYSREDYNLARHNLDRTVLNGTASAIKSAASVTEALDYIEKKYGGANLSRRGGKKSYEGWQRIAIAWHGGNPDGGEIKSQVGEPMSDFMIEAHILDGGSKKAYYSTIEEMAARAFQSWVEDKLESLGRRNDYLSSFASNEYHYDHLLGIEWKPFPEGEERQRINAAFDKFMAVVARDNVLAKALQALGMM